MRFSDYPDIWAERNLFRCTENTLDFYLTEAIRTVLLKDYQSQIELKHRQLAYPCTINDRLRSSINPIAPVLTGCGYIRQSPTAASSWNQMPSNTAGNLTPSIKT